jgi:hypothetical protein
MKHHTGFSRCRAHPSGAPLGNQRLDYRAPGPALLLNHISTFAKRHLKNFSISQIHLPPDNPIAFSKEEPA